MCWYKIRSVDGMKKFVLWNMIDCILRTLFSWLRSESLYKVPLRLCHYERASRRNNLWSREQDFMDPESTSIFTFDFTDLRTTSKQYIPIVYKLLYRRYFITAAQMNWDDVYAYILMCLHRYIVLIHRNWHLYSRYTCSTGKVGVMKSMVESS